MALQPFLCLTALEDFWDLRAARPVFLGPWCVRQGAKSTVGAEAGEILPHPYDDREQMWKAALYQEDVTERVFHVLSAWLREQHGHGDREYWRMVVWPWLWHYVMLAHEHYLCLEEGCSPSPGISGR